MLCGLELSSALESHPRSIHLASKALARFVPFLTKGWPPRLHTTPLSFGDNDKGTGGHSDNRFIPNRH
ncbi:hypothetical protein RHMOL_Rhmol10G0121000 [Rhododendron molle]|uniref:Uncharacterized protein n=1 Tax=Rhododendron molle TaxID=49168 RepID=A0ACC0M1W7_RHOML|nr:hypothetical protein RHMOL_Rhmol10G0121000 [Rhododendron molle]